MTDNLIYIYLHQQGEDTPVGRLWTRSHNGRESATFRYDESWQKRPDSFELEPSLPLSDGAQYTPAGRSIFACFSDCAPDTWGRVLARSNSNGDLRQLVILGSSLSGARPKASWLRQKLQPRYQLAYFTHKNKTSFKHNII